MAANERYDFDNSSTPIPIAYGRLSTLEKLNRLFGQFIVWDPALEQTGT